MSLLMEASSMAPTTWLVATGIFVAVGLSHPLVAIFIFLVIAALLLQARKNYGVLEKCGIPVVKPTMFRGSEPNLHKTVLHLADIERFKKFGGIWGSYVGRNPQVYIADPELIRLVFVKDFVHFGDRQDLDTGVPMMDEILDYQPGERWKHLRTSLSPLFTTAKLRQMSDVMARSAAEFMDDLNSECDAEGRLKIDCRKRLTTWLIDMFTQTTLNIRMEDAKKTDNQFAEAFREMLRENEEYNFLFSLSFSFPFLKRYAPTFNQEPSKRLTSTFRRVMESRQKNGKGSSTTRDFLDVLCDLWDRKSSTEFQQLGITETTVISQAIDFFLGGYETTATTLSHLLLDLAEHPEVQEKMYQELMAALANNNDGQDKERAIDHELINDSEIPYILACIQESLRLAPPLYRPERICTKDWSHGDVTIKKGTVVMLAAWPANRNPKVYGDQPDEFIPERFLSENKSNLDPYAFTSFGFGQRNCIGKRFAYENLKIFTCNLIKNFRVEKRTDTKLSYKGGSMLIVGFRPLYLDLVQRK